jgi:hypothetical protein
MLRHTFGTALADEGVPIERIRDLMGHRDIRSSAIYIRVSAEQKKAAVERIDRRPWILRWISRHRNRTFRFFNGPRPLPEGVKYRTVGRKLELGRLKENLAKGVDTLVIGPTGSGKSHLLSLLEGERIIRLPSLSPVRGAVITLAEELHHRGVLRVEPPEREEDVRDDLGEEKPTVDRRPETREEDSALSSVGSSPSSVDSFDSLRKRHTRTTVRGWVQMISEAVAEDNRKPKTEDRNSGPLAWTLIVDDLSDLSASVGRLIDPLNRAFVLFAAAVEVRKPFEKHFWKLERVPIGNLSRLEASDLIRQASYGAEIEDYRLFETHVLQQSAGNPRAILEMVDRLRKERSISRDAVREVSHEGARGKLDLTPALVVAAALFFAFRYVSRGMDSMDGYMLAGIGSAVIMTLRFFMSRMRR